jgi:hypothetical protein
VNGTSHQDTSITELLSRARLAIKSGENSLRAAAEDIAVAQDRGASQRRIAKEVGRSAAWVNRLLRWRKRGYQDDTPFGPQSKASRQRAQGVDAAEQNKQNAKESATTSERARAAAARARAEAAKAEAARAEAEARKAKAEAAKAEADARTAKAKADARRSHRAFRQASGEKPIHSGPRELLVKALGMLGSDQAGERDNAACFAERTRKKLGMTWDELIIPADQADPRRREARADFHTSN